jgi:hypothetical protein
VQQFNGCQLFKEEQNTGVELFVPGAGEEEELTCVITWTHREAFKVTSTEAVQHDHAHDAIMRA